MTLFLAGAFLSSLIINYIGRNQRFSYVIPLVIEGTTLLMIAVFGYRYDGSLVGREVFAGSLLFSMGMQNALVSLVSGSVVRTTHLTGTFTDLGIELAQLFKPEPGELPSLLRKLKLRATIIFSFLSGAISGAYLFHFLSYHAFFIPVFLLCYTLFYDIFRVRLKRSYRRASLFMSKSDHDHFLSS
jgi:uncharacterized membrane protein YoaK (UPF0700 family)